MKRVSRASNPYPADLARGFDLVPILGLQEAIGAGELKLYYFRARVSYQRKRLPSEVRRTGKLGEGRIKIIGGEIHHIEYDIGSRIPSNSDVRPQKEILSQIADGLGLERREEALGINIKERIIMHKIKDLPKKLQNLEAFQGYEDLDHLQEAVGDYTEVVNKSLRLPSGFLTYLPAVIREELVSNNIVDQDDKVLGKIRSVLRTDYIKPLEGTWGSIGHHMLDLHKELIAPYWWQDVGDPSVVRFENGFTRRINAQIYQLLKRRYYVAVQLPEELLI